jgi:acyl-coenzyme A synthetase/AMP-(fatty) acid ligase
VIGIDDSARGQVVTAFVATTLDPTSLQSFCAENLAPYKVPQDVRILEELPKRSSGKVDKKALELT